jgi:isoleucyl-tRNA synthetase
MRYRDTLLLPKTDFPMKADLPKREPQWLARWQSLGVYGRLRASRAGRRRYVLHDGPPYSNNHIHLGTAANKIWKDVVIRFRSLLGEDAPWVPGWDNHGMPIENEVAREFRKKHETPDRLALRRRCREYADHWVGVHRTEFARLGIVADWENPYLTMSSDFESEIVAVFATLAERGYIYRGLRSIHWCPTCRSALAEAEIEYEDDPSPSIFVAFPHRPGERRDGAVAGGRVAALDTYPGLAALAWTTTPWTLPANQFLMVGPGFEYAVVEAGGRNYLLAAERVGAAREVAGWREVRVVERYTGKELLGAIFENPFGRPAPLVDGTPYVVLDEGTGIVHGAPGHGKEDFTVGQREGFEPLNPVDAGGILGEAAGPFAGQHIFKADAPIIVWLRDAGRLLAETSFTHPYPHCWRCKGAVIFRATEQWFLSIDHDHHRERALAAIQEVRWDPPGSRNRIHDAVAGRPDWCLSRQRSWGVGIPAIYCEPCGEAILDRGVMANVVERSRRLGSDDWYDAAVEEFLPKDFACPRCAARGPFRKETDILDVWFDSGCTHRVVCERRADQGWPADLYLEGPDQHRGWFNSSLMVAVATRDAAPYRAVQTHGWILDGEGRAMHKSLGNVISPQTVIDKLGADIVRLWACSADWRTDVRAGDEILERVADAYRKVRNTFRFLLANLGTWRPPNAAAALDLARRDPVNAAFLGRLLEGMGEVRAEYEASRNHLVVQRLVDLCTTDLSAVFLDLRKDALYALAEDDPLRRSTQAVLAVALEQLVLAWSPVLSFTTDEVWNASPWLAARGESVLLAEWPDPAAAAGERAAQDAERWRRLLAVRDAVYRALEPRRAAREFASFAEVSVTLAADGEVRALLDTMDDEAWRSLLLVSEVFVETLNGEGAALEAKAGMPAEQPLGPGAGRLVTLFERTKHARCERCWIHRASVGEVEGHPTLCRRCVDALPAGFVLREEPAAG